MFAGDENIIMGALTGYGVGKSINNGPIADIKYAGKQKIDTVVGNIKAKKVETERKSEMVSAYDSLASEGPNGGYTKREMGNKARTYINMSAEDVESMPNDKEREFARTLHQLKGSYERDYNVPEDVVVNKVRNIDTTRQEVAKKTRRNVRNRRRTTT
jgi:hypothetical protein